MNEKLQQYLNQKEQENFEIKESKKRALLLKEGLYDLQYSDEWSQGGTWDNESGKYVIPVPIQITDEEYQLLKESCTENNESVDEDVDNNIVSALKVIAWIIYICGFITGFVVGGNTAEYYSDFNFTVALVCWVVTLIQGTMFLGFAEIIKLLDVIKRK